MGQYHDDHFSQPGQKYLRPQTAAVNQRAFSRNQKTKILFIFNNDRPGINLLLMFRVHAFNASRNKSNRFFGRRSFYTQKVWWTGTEICQLLDFIWPAEYYQGRFKSML